MPLTGAAAVHTVTTADDGWYRDVTSFAQHTAWLHAAMAFYTLAGIGALALMAAYAWWDARRRADRAAMAAVAWLGLGTLLAVGAGLALKQVFTETRPCLAMPSVATVQPCPGPTDYSFPSDHTTVAAALAVGLWIVSRRLGLIAAVLALLEGFSRIYLGQHYPHDVAAGLALSTLILLAGWPLARHPLGRVLARLENTPVRPVLTSMPSN
jgi:membrane-associated phospholipid phosphatase